MQKWLSVVWFLENLWIIDFTYGSDLDVFFQKKYKRKLLVGKSLYFYIRVQCISPRTHLPKIWLRPCCVRKIADIELDLLELFENVT